MEDLITIVIAIAIGLASMLAGQKNKKKVPKPSNSESDGIPSEVLERELSGASETSAKTAQPSTLDILGRILSGDLSDLIGQPKPPPQVVDSEYVDPMTARRRRQAKEEAERKQQQELIALRSKKKVEPMSPIAASLQDPASIRQAIVVNEVLNKPLSLRRHRRVG